jgi:hypothetical protein
MSFIAPQPRQARPPAQNAAPATALVPLVANMAGELRAHATSRANQGGAIAVIQAAILTLLVRLLTRLEGMIHLWQAGQLRAPSPASPPPHATQAPATPAPTLSWPTLSWPSLFLSALWPFAQAPSEFRPATARPRRIRSRPSAGSTRAPAHRPACHIILPEPASPQRRPKTRDSALAQPPHTPPPPALPTRSVPAPAFLQKPACPSPPSHAPFVTI